MSRYICAFVYRVDITYSCAGRANDSFCPEEEHEHQYTQFHNSNRFTRDDIEFEKALKNCQSIEVLEVERRIYHESDVYLVYFKGKLVVVPKENGLGGLNYFLARIAESLEQGIEYLKTGELDAHKKRIQDVVDYLAKGDK